MEETAAGTISTSNESGTSGTQSRESIAAMNQRAHAAVDKAAQMANQTTDWLTNSHKELSDKTVDYVKAKPLQSIGIAFASGLLLGKLLR
jgi:ElaB/YqjD/DUF883 family membrane-anchored ribosome-binding protein